MTYLPAQPTPAEENVNRGTVVALLAIPAGVIVWVIIWSIGFIASIVSFGVAILAMFLYKLGSGGLMGRAGAVRVTFITIITIALSIFAGLVADVAIGIGQIANVSPIEALSNPVFWDVFSEYTSSADSALIGSILLSVGFGALGCFSILRGAWKSTAAGAVVQPQPQTPASDPTQPPTAWPTAPTEETPPR